MRQRFDSCVDQINEWQASSTYPGSFRITFAPDLVGTIDLDWSQPLVIEHCVEIVGPGVDLLTIDAQNNSRVFEIGEDATAVISGLTITGGGGVDIGAGIYNAGDLTLDAVHVTDNHTRAYSGNWNDYGGGISSINGSLHIKNSTIDSNSARLAGGIRFAANSADDTLEITNSLISSNIAQESNNGYFLWGGIALESTTASAPITITNSTISGNRSGYIGGISVGERKGVRREKGSELFSRQEKQF